MSKFVSMTIYWFLCCFMLGESTLASALNSHQADCSESTITINIMPGHSYNDITWDLVDTNKNNALIGSGGFEVGNIVHTYNFCVPSSCFSFTINNTYGEGIVNGFYEIFFDKVMVGCGVEFKFSETKNFCFPNSRDDHRSSLQTNDYISQEWSKTPKNNYSGYSRKLSNNQKTTVTEDLQNHFYKLPSLRALDLSSSPSFAPSTSPAETRFVWHIGSGEITNDLSESNPQIVMTHKTIGSPESTIKVKLYRYDCLTPVPTDDAVSITNVSFNLDIFKAQYTIELNKSQLGSSDVLINDENLLKFCIDIGLYANESKALPVLSEKTKFEMIFYLSHDQFDADINTDIEDSVTVFNIPVAVNNIFSLTGCLCSSFDTCDTLPDDSSFIEVKENSEIFICLIPSSGVKLTEYDLIIESTTAGNNFSYKPVTFNENTGEQELTPFTSIQEFETTIRIKTQVLSDLFTAGVGTAEISGSGTLELTGIGDWDDDDSFNDDNGGNGDSTIFNIPIGVDGGYSLTPCVCSSSYTCDDGTDGIEMEEGSYITICLIPSDGVKFKDFDMTISSTTEGNDFSYNPIALNINTGEQELSSFTTIEESGTFTRVRTQLVPDLFTGGVGTAKISGSGFLALVNKDDIGISNEFDLEIVLAGKKGMINSIICLFNMSTTMLYGLWTLLLHINRI